MRSERKKKETYQMTIDNTIAQALSPAQPNQHAV